MKIRVVTETFIYQTDLDIHFQWKIMGYRYTQWGTGKTVCLRYMLKTYTFLNLIAQIKTIDIRAVFNVDIFTECLVQFETQFYFLMADNWFVNLSNI